MNSPNKTSTYNHKRTEHTTHNIVLVVLGLWLGGDPVEEILGKEPGGEGRRDTVSMAMLVTQIR